MPIWNSIPNKADLDAWARADDAHSLVELQQAWAQEAAEWQAGVYLLPDTAQLGALLNTLASGASQQNPSPAPPLYLAVADSRMPDPELLRKSNHWAVYLSGDHSPNPQSAKRIDPWLGRPARPLGQQITLLRKLALLQPHLSLVVDPEAIRDPFHLVELTAPHATRLLLLRQAGPWRELRELWDEHHTP